MNLIDLIDLAELKKLAELIDHRRTSGLSNATISIIVH